MYKERRKALGWTRSELANRAHVNKATLQLIEMGHSLDDESIARIEEALSRAESGEKDVMLPRVAVGKKS